jgi:hypothetical protein
LQLLVAEDLSEPFAYELLREAWALRDSSPRSSVLIAIAALEVGVKQYIADRVKPAKWLVNNLPAPDVIRILQKYLPSLEPPPDAIEGAATFEPLSSKLRNLLADRRDQRNDITHKPDVHQQEAQAATPDDARSAVLAVRQVLLRLDVADDMIGRGNISVSRPTTSRRAALAGSAVAAGGSKTKPDCRRVPWSSTGIGPSSASEKELLVTSPRSRRT